MIDVHCHILPEVDDGAESMQQAINMAKIAQEEGISKMIATPHYHPEFKYEKGEELKRIRERFKKELKENNNQYRCNHGQDSFLITVTVGKE